MIDTRVHPCALLWQVWMVPTVEQFGPLRYSHNIGGTMKLLDFSITRAHHTGTLLTGSRPSGSRAQMAAEPVSWSHGCSDCALRRSLGQLKVNRGQGRPAQAFSLQRHELKPVPHEVPNEGIRDIMIFDHSPAPRTSRWMLPLVEFARCNRRGRLSPFLLQRLKALLQS